MVANMHPETACFQGGLRMYKVVMLGEGGVGKSGKVLFDCMKLFFVQWNVKIDDSEFGGSCLAEIFGHYEQDAETMRLKQLVVLCLKILDLYLSSQFF